MEMKKKRIMSEYQEIFMKLGNGKEMGNHKLQNGVMPLSQLAIHIVFLSQ